MTQFAQLKQDPIFIIGAARSGTTWVYDILRNHPQVAGIYESWLFTPNNGVGSLFSDAHWPAKRSGLGNFMSREKVLQYSRELAVNIMAHAIESETQYLVEKSPNHVFAIPLIREIFPEAKFICVIRDGRDVAVSVRAAARSWSKDWRHSFGRSMWSSARAWKYAIQRARQEAQSLGNDYMEIRYEQIHEDPLTAYQIMFDFCQIAYDESVLQGIFTATDFSRNYKPGETKFRRGGRVGDWKHSFSLVDTLMFKQAAGDLLIDLGYERDHTWNANSNILPRKLGGQA
nr:sulfotransferase [Anaerolineae bacterium]